MTARHELLKNLLDYVRQSEGTDPGPRPMPSDLLNPDQLAGLPGVELFPEDDVLLRVSRLHPTPPPRLPKNAYSAFFQGSEDPLHPPRLKRAELETTLRTQPDPDPDLADTLAEAQTLFEYYLNSWNAWATPERPIRQAIALYDRLFDWRIHLTMTVERPQELVLGVGLVHWPAAGGNYDYPLITTLLEIAQQQDALEIRACLARPRLEFEYFLQQPDLLHSGELYQQLSQALQDGRQISPQDYSSYSDLVSAAIHGLSAQGIYQESPHAPPHGPTPAASLAWRIFLRNRSTSLIHQDIEALKRNLEQWPEDQLPAQLLNLVTPPSQAREVPQTPVCFRGRGGLEGQGSTVQELFFPLPYNHEQITIIERLNRQDGVVVQGPPGTGKTHTIANIICHALALGQRVLVTAEKAHVLKTVQSKIPEDIRPLVVSRAGSDREGQRQLESSIDLILQRVAQLDPTQLSAEIQQLDERIEHTQRELLRIDRRIRTLAQAHYADLELDGVIQKPARVAEWVMQGEAEHGWLDDALSLDPQHAPPVQESDMAALRQARAQVGPDLAYLSTTLVTAARWPEPQQVLQLHQTLLHLRDLSQQQASGQLWPLLTPPDQAQDTLQALRASLHDRLDHVQALQQLQQEKPWTVAALRHFTSADSQTELAALNQLLPELDQLSTLRAQLLNQPITVPELLWQDPRALACIAQAAVSGKPFGLFSLVPAATKQLLAQITVSGHTPATLGDWQAIQQRVDWQKTVTTLLTRYQQLAPLLDLPAVSGPQADLLLLLRELELLTRALRQMQALTQVLKQPLQPNPTDVLRGPEGQKMDQPGDVQTVLQQVDQHLHRLHLEQSRAQYRLLQQLAQQQSGTVGDTLRQLVLTLDQPQSEVDLLTQYSQQMQQLIRLEQLQPQFNTIRTLADRIEAAGAPRLAGRLRTVPSPSASDDPALPTDWREAWQWRRAKNHLDQISDRTELQTLAQQRRECEQQLARGYQQVVAQRAWLGLKTNLTPHVISALNRYKTAVQKIGKNTGKNAPRHRREAQDALTDAAAAIPCWVMTQAQVSESMPAQPGLFDLIIVDEASQSTFNALPVLMRGKKILIVGDDKQVSPSFVGLSAERVGELKSKFLAGQPRANAIAPDLSLYAIAKNIYPAQVELQEHFRCHPAIIEYSNRTYYDGHIKPLRISKASERLDPPLVSIYVPDGVRHKGRSSDLNRPEAQAIIAEIRLLLDDPKFRGRSIGVVSLLGPAQAQYISEQAKNQLDVHELTQREFACGDASAFQGAERDIMFLSMVAPPEDCHPLSRLDHQQRLNVAASRARERMYLVHSVQSTDLSPLDLRLGLLQQFSPSPVLAADTRDQLLAQCESGFERDVMGCLLDRGYTVQPQVWAGQFRLDMVVEGAADARLAIECDGDAFHGPDQWDADLRRQRALERAGWTFWRCFASAWTLRREEVLNDLLQTLANMGIEPLFAQASSNPLVVQKVWQPPAPALSS